MHDDKPRWLRVYDEMERGAAPLLIGLTGTWAALSFVLGLGRTVAVGYAVTSTLAFGYRYWALWRDTP